MDSWVTKYLHQIKPRLDDKNKIENTHCAVIFFIELGVACTAFPFIDLFQSETTFIKSDLILFKFRVTRHSIPRILPFAWLPFAF